MKKRILRCFVGLIATFISVPLPGQDSGCWDLGKPDGWCGFSAETNWWECAPWTSAPNFDPENPGYDCNLSGG